MQPLISPRTICRGLICPIWRVRSEHQAVLLRERKELVVAEPAGVERAALIAPQRRLKRGGVIADYCQRALDRILAVGKGSASARLSTRTAIISAPSSWASSMSSARLSPQSKGSGISTSGASRKASFSLAQGSLPPKSGAFSAGVTPSSALLSAEIWPSSVPQQPPKKATPASENARAVAANSSGGQS